MADVHVRRRMSVASDLATIAEALADGRSQEAQRLADELPRPPVTTLEFGMDSSLAEAVMTTGRPPALKPRQKLAIYLRDGFICRYSPERWRLVHPGALRVLSLLLPEQMPTELGPHNIPAKYATNSPVWFDVWPAVDHIVPRAGGGLNDPDNLICVSWWRNNSKRAVPLHATGWGVQPPGDLKSWDGLTGWFHDRVSAMPDLLKDPMVRNWHFPEVG